MTAPITDLEMRLDAALKRAAKKPRMRTAAPSNKPLVKTVSLGFSVEQFDIMAHALMHYVAQAEFKDYPQQMQDVALDLLTFFNPR